MTVQGVGASLSPAPGGWLAQAFGYSVSFALLGSLAIGSLALWLGFSPILNPVCATVRREENAAGDLAAATA